MYFSPFPHVYTYIYIYNVYFSEPIIHSLSGGQKLHYLSRRISKAKRPITCLVLHYSITDLGGSLAQEECPFHCNHKNSTIFCVPFKPLLLISPSWSPFLITMSVLDSLLPELFRVCNITQCHHPLWQIALQWLLSPPSVQLSCSVMSDFATPRIAARQVSLSITNSRSSHRLTSIESMMPSSHLILCRPFLLLPSIPPSTRVFSNESTLCMRWPEYQSFSFSIIPSKEIPGLTSFRMDWFYLLAVQGTLKSLLQHHSSKDQFFGTQLSSQSNSHIHTWLLEKP